MGADVNVANCEGRTALHSAILKGNKSMVELLLKNGANCHAKTGCGETPLLTAIHRNDLEIIDLLLKCGGHLGCIDRKSLAEMLSLAARNCCVKKLEALRKAGADLNMVDQINQTALHKAVLCNCPDVVNYLLNYGAERDLKDIMGYTAMDYAKKLNFYDIVELLSSDYEQS